MFLFYFISISISQKIAQETIRGVNIGGWLVSEPWITPSLYQPYINNGVVDEYTLCQHLGKESCQKTLEKHWNTFFTEEDVRKIKEANLNLIRIPIGYWAVDIINEPYVQGQIPYMLRALQLARKYGLKVMIDLHGAPGSQNGFDNSGQKKNKQEWSLSHENIKRTIEALKRLVIQFKDYEDIYTLEVLNEPHGGQMKFSFIQLFYKLAYMELRAMDYNKKLWFGDGFFPQQWTNMKGPEYNDVGIDSHFYYVFEYGMMQAYQYNPKSVHDVICKSRKDQLTKAENGVDRYEVPHIVGEWSGALTDCAKWLNGIGVGSRYDGTFEKGQKVGEGLTCNSKETYSQWTPQYKEEVKKHIELQMNSYEVLGGWIFWNFKTERADAWNYLKGVDMGYIPKNPAQLTYKC